MKVAVLGAAGGIGQSLSLLLKLQLPPGFELALYDLAPVTPGVAVDLSHIPTDVTVHGYSGEDPSPALQGADIVIIPAGVARKPGMDRSDLFKFNAGVIKNLVQHCARECPNALLAIITNPVNSIIPIAAEVLRQAGVYDRRKLFGVTTLDVIRAETFVANAMKCRRGSLTVPVIGGHSGTTILPLFSQVVGQHFTHEQLDEMTRHVQNAGTDVVNAKAGAGSATLAMAQAGLRFCLSLVHARQGEPGVVEYAYVEGDSPHARFFAQAVRIGAEGIEEVMDYGSLSALENAELEGMLQTLRAEIELGINYARQ
jgi:malate dehydrogenase